MSTRLAKYSLHVVIISILLIIFTSCTASTATKGDANNLENILLEENFDQELAVESWAKSQTVTVNNGMCIMRSSSTKLYAGSTLTYKNTFDIPEEDNAYLKFSVSINNTKEVNGGKCSGSAEYFILPSYDNTNSYWSSPDSLYILYAYDNDMGTITLYAKQNMANKTGGITLYKGNFQTFNYPIEMSIYFNRDNYQISFDKEVNMASGAIAGKHNLPIETCGGKVRCGIQMANNIDGYSHEMTVDYISISNIKFIKNTVNKINADIDSMLEIKKEIYGENNENIIRINPNAAYNINGVKDTQFIFGVDVNGGSTNRKIPEIKALNFNSIRSYYWLFYDENPWRKTPWYYMHYKTGTPVSEDEAMKLWDEWFRQDFSKTMNQAYLKSKNSSMLQQLDILQEWDFSGHITVQPLQLDGTAEKYPNEIAEFYDEYIKHLESRLNPDLKLGMIMLYNEPDYLHFAGMYANTSFAVNSFIKIYNNLYKKLKVLHPEVQLIGPCLSSNAFYTWTGWKAWTLPHLNKAVNVDYFNYHSYHQTQASVLSWASMLQAYTFNERKISPKSVITETNWLNFGESKDRFIWNAEQTFMMLSNPDKFYERDFFILTGGSVKYSPTNFANEAIFNDSNNVLTENDNYWFYWATSRVRGEARYIQPYMDSDLKSYASVPDKNHIVLCIFNDSFNGKNVKIDPGFNSSNFKGKTVVREVYYDDFDNICHKETISENNAFSPPIFIPAYGLICIDFEVNENEIKYNSEVSQKEYFAKETELKFGKNKKELIIRNGDGLGQIKNAFLRLGIFSDNMLFAESISFEFNNKDYDINLKDVSPGRGSAGTNIWVIDIPLNTEAIKKNNKIILPEQDTEYVLMFASIVIQND